MVNEESTDDTSTIWIEIWFFCSRTFTVLLSSVKRSKNILNSSTLLRTFTERSRVTCHTAATLPVSRILCDFFKINRHVGFIFELYRLCNSFYIFKRRRWFSLYVNVERLNVDALTRDVECRTLNFMLTLNVLKYRLLEAELLNSFSNDWVGHPAILWCSRRALMMSGLTRGMAQSSKYLF